MAVGYISGGEPVSNPDTITPPAGATHLLVVLGSPNNGSELTSTFRGNAPDAHHWHAYTPSGVGGSVSCDIFPADVASGAGILARSAGGCRYAWVKLAYSAAGFRDTSYGEESYNNTISMSTGGAMDGQNGDYAFGGAASQGNASSGGDAGTNCSKDAGGNFGSNCNYWFGQVTADVTAGVSFGWSYGGDSARDAAGVVVVQLRIGGGGHWVYSRRLSERLDQIFRPKILVPRLRLPEFEKQGAVAI